MNIPATPHRADVPADPLAHIAVQDCYQCGKCTAGCPVADHMDVVPNQVVRLVQLGRAEAAAGASGIWECVSCQTCSTRCPKSVDCAAVMDALRQRSGDPHRAALPARRTVLFQRAFLQNIRRNGRLNELELIAQFKTSAFLGDFSVPLLMKDALLAPKMRARRKLHVIGEKVRDRKLVHRIFARCEGGAAAPTTEG